MRKGFRNRNCVEVALVVFHHADTTTIRLLLGCASAGYAVLLLWPMLVPHIHAAYCWAFSMFHSTCGPTAPMIPLFDRPAYALMAIVPGGELTWAALFMAHFVGVHWRVIDRVERVRWGIVVNVLGFAIWAYSTAALNIALGQILPGTALEWTLVLFSGWALYRTGLKRELVTV